MTDKERYEELKNIFNSQEFLSFVGMKLEHIERGRAVISCENKKEFSQYLGYMHGGMITSIADTAGGQAAATVIEDDQKIVTSELKIHFLKPITVKKVIAEGIVISSGKKLIIVESTVKDEEENLLAKMIATMYVIDYVK